MNNNKQFLVPIGEGLTAKSDSSLDIHRELNSQIVIVIEACGVELTPKDKGYKGDCPFCGVPSSLSVSAEKQVFYCRGCRGGGNSISFVQKFHDKSFTEAVAWLVDLKRIG